jgi:hypothetical protein
LREKAFILVFSLIIEVPSVFGFNHFDYFQKMKTRIQICKEMPEIERGRERERKGR